uniref:Uncharacterized protein n=1 Tax=Anguilla anguilla TaxID=7936 RepID=A0A0E9WFH0_ANGAN
MCGSNASFRSCLCWCQSLLILHFSVVARYQKKTKNPKTEIKTG